jgi:ribulose-phosphate 3-epimerase
LDGLKTGAELEVDGGISPENASEVAQAGASILVAGNSIFDAGKPVPDAIRDLREAARQGVLKKP